MAELNHHFDEVKDLGATLVAASPELPQFLNKIVMMHNLNFDILFDDRNELADQFGVKWQYQDDLKALYRDKFQINLEYQQGNPDWTLPLPLRFVIDQSGLIRYAESKVDYRERPDPVHMLDALRAI